MCLASLYSSWAAADPLFAEVAQSYPGVRILRQVHWAQWAVCMVITVYQAVLPRVFKKTFGPFLVLLLLLEKGTLILTFSINYVLGSLFQYIYVCIFANQLMFFCINYSRWCIIGYN